MAMKIPSKLALAGAGLALAASQAHAQLSIFEDVPIAYSVSGDGRWAVLGSTGGTGGSAVMLWSAATNTETNIGGLTGAGGQLKVSQDGSYIAGSTLDSNGNLATSIYNMSKGTWSVVPNLGGSSSGTAAATWALSADGRYVGGSSYVPGSTVAHGFITDTLTGKVTDLGTTQARVSGISPGATTLVGYTTSGQSGSMWTLNADGSYTQHTLMNPNAPTQSLSITNAMSGNGLWAAGAGFNTSLPYRVNIQTGAVQFFNELPASYSGNPVGKATSTPAAVSADGNTMVGIYTPQGGTLANSYGFIWKADGTVSGNTLGGTMETFDDYLASYGIDTANQYNFVSVIGMNADATVFSGIAIDNSTDSPVAFVVSIPVPEPSDYALLASGLAVLAWVARRRRAQA